MSKKVEIGQIWVEKLSPGSTKTPRRIEIVTIGWNGWIGYRNVATRRPAAIATENLPKKYTRDTTAAKTGEGQS